MGNRKGYVRKRTAKPTEGRKAKWQVRYQDPLGEWRTRQFSRKAEAEQWLKIQETDILRGEWVDPKRTQLSSRSGRAPGWSRRSTSSRRRGSGTNPY